MVDDTVFPFTMVPIVVPRQSEKPRTHGLTMVVDGGTPLGALADGLEMAGAYCDIGKIKVGSAHLYAEDYLRRKIALYRDHGCDVFPGGQFLEYVIHVQGIDGATAYIAETGRLGFTAIEISDNVVDISDEDRLRLLDACRDAGLKVFSEVGAKHDVTEPEELVRQAKLSLDAGATLVLVEAAEFVEGGKIKQAVLDQVTAALDMRRVMIELPGPWIPTVSASLIEDMKKSLIRSIGPDVNLGNVAFDMVLELEGARVGLGTEGPPGMRRNAPSA